MIYCFKRDIWEPIQKNNKKVNYKINQYNYLIDSNDIMTNTKKLTSIWIITIIGFISKVSAITVQTIKRTTDTADHDLSQIDGSRSIFDIISLVNSYLWFAIWFVCFLFMIINGYKLIINNWDEKQTSTATSWLLKSIIWIIICLLAYVIVNLAVKIFA
jgi:hypothetical protein